MFPFRSSSLSEVSDINLNLLLNQTQFHYCELPSPCIIVCSRHRKGITLWPHISLIEQHHLTLTVGELSFRMLSGYLVPASEGNLRPELVTESTRCSGNENCIEFRQCHYN